MKRERVVESVELMMTRSMTQNGPAARFLMKGSERSHGAADPSSNGL